MTNSAPKRNDSSLRPTAPASTNARLAEVVAELRKREALRNESLLDFVPRVTETAVRPTHLARLADLFTRIDRGERVRACISVPPQHWKTTTVLHGFAWLLKRHPAWTLAYSTYQLAQGYSKSREARDIARAAGVALHEEMQNLGEWRTRDGGGGLFTSIDGPLTGKAARVVVIDDPYKDDLAARSEATRERVRDWVKAVALTRLPESGSLLIVHTRWYEHDLIGETLNPDRLLLGERYEDINLPFLADDDGRPVRAPYTHGTRVLLPRQTTPRGDVIGWTVEGSVRQLVSMGDKADALAQGIPRKQVEGALWTWDTITPWRLTAEPPRSRCEVYVDPNASDEAHAAKADDAGIVTIARGVDGRAYVLDDASGHVGTTGWPARAVGSYRTHKAHSIVIESDGGGDLNKKAIEAWLYAEALEKSRATGRHVEPERILIRLVRVGGRGDKRGRAETARHLYGDPLTGRPSVVSHVGHHARLEQSMTAHDFATSKRSPGDLDALSLGLAELMLAQHAPTTVRATMKITERTAGW